MINIVLYEPEIPQNTGNIMRTCVATNSVLHLIRPLGFNINDKTLKRSAVNYTDKLVFHIYDDYEDFKSKNKGEYYFFTRYGNKTHSSINYKDKENIYLIFGKESTGIPKEILKDNINNCIRIPMSDNVRAINLSNSVAIGIYEVLRQIDYEGLYFEEPHKGKDYLIK
ncbi:MAG: tRNA (cytidine(34)-2'-O)-methyltransferase [Tenericutes bacterium]|jgi:tRNA (cytidine/uridine-2'-O-)-methyltransferase|nr:tRNA (cytidine(34)-2'-O)-methyltransferase [Mycoplasmatota bacterium]